MDVKKLSRFHVPGHRATGDRTELEPNRGVGYDYLHCVIDDHSRVAYVELHPREISFGDGIVETIAGDLPALGEASRSLGRRIAAEVGQDHPEVHDARLTGARVARLATLDPDGRAHLVPIVFALDGDTLYSAVDRKPKRSRRLRRIENARARADVTILVDHYEEDWGRLWWIRLRGHARVLDTGKELERALALLCEKYPQYADDPPEGPVLAVDVTEVSEWSVAAGR